MAEIFGPNGGHYGGVPLVCTCEMSQLVLGGMAKGHELLQQLLYRGIVSRTLSLPLITYSCSHSGHIKIYDDGDIIFHTIKYRVCGQINFYTCNYMCSNLDDN